MPSPQKPTSLARSLGQFFGHLWTSTTKPAPGNPKVEVRRETTQHQVDTPTGPVTLRRTTIEEIELPPGGQSPPRG
jgi:hypothetical protein